MGELGFTNDDLRDSLVLRNTPVFVEVGIHPYFFMFHSEKAEDPIHVGYGNPTVAGVLTGFDASVPEKEYWEVFISSSR